MSEQQIGTVSSKGMRKAKYIGLVLSILSVFLFLGFCSSSPFDKPKRIAEEYLKAIQIQDYPKILALSEMQLVGSYVDKGILINLVDWKFIHQKKISSELKELDLSREAFDNLCKTIIFADKVKSINDSKIFKQVLEMGRMVGELYPEINTDDDYGAWRAFTIHAKEAFRKDDGYYYYDKTQKVEYLLDITCTNKLGMQLKKKYMLVVQKDDKGEWKVIEFAER
jgi:hypothetical protein